MSMRRVLGAYFRSAGQAPKKHSTAAGIALVYLMLVAALSACGSEPPPTATLTPEPTQTPAPPTPEPTQAPAPPVEKTLTLLYWQAPSVPGSYLSAGAKDVDAGAITLDPLAKYDPDGNLAPALAAEIPTLENGGFSRDLTSITWKLKEGLKWSDGSDVSAEDVVFTRRYCVNEETGCTSESSFDGIASVEALDSLTVKITFEAPTPYPYQAFVGAGAPIISRAQFADCIGAAATTCHAQNNAPLGTGPYRIIDFKANEQAVYERNPFYRGPSPYFDRVGPQGRRRCNLRCPRRHGTGRSRLCLEHTGGTGGSCRSGRGRTGHGGRRLHQPGGTHRC